MSIMRLLLGAALLSAAAAVYAHAHVTGSVPADHSTGEAPERIELSFSETARITALALQRDGQEAHKLTPPAGAAARFTIPVPRLSPGSYTLSWRVVSDDGHVMTGTLHFIVVPPPERGSASSGSNHGT
jgi:methionine-rich copper-binding protein CopC